MKFKTARQHAKPSRPPSFLRNCLKTAGPPLAIGFCVLALSVAAAGTIAALVMGDQIADTAADLIGHTGWFGGRAG